MNQSDRQTNLRLKREVLRLATRVSAAFPGTAVAEIALMRTLRRELGGLEDCEQNQSLNDHLLFLQEMLQEMQQVRRCRPVIQLRRLLLLRSLQ